MGAKLHLDVIPIPEMPYRYEARNIIISKKKEGEKPSSPIQKSKAKKKIFGKIRKIVNRKGSGYGFISINCQRGEVWFHSKDCANGKSNFY